MTMSETQSVAELHRRIGELQAQVTALAVSVAADYPRKDLVSLQMSMLEAKIDDLRKDADAIAAQQAATRRLIVSVFIGPILVALTLAILVSQGGMP